MGFRDDNGPVPIRLAGEYEQIPERRAICGMQVPQLLLAWRNRFDEVAAVEI